MVFSSRNLAVILACASSAVALRVPRFATVASRGTVAETEYDFVIAGGGVSGLTVADRLTEDPSINVLVIETGPFDKDEDSVLVPGAFFPVPYLWLGLNSSPQAALNNRSFAVPAGRVVGGGSVVNGMVYVRSGKTDYAAWEKLGAKGWGWDGLFPYFKKSENFTMPPQEFADVANISVIESAHGSDGPVRASYPNYFFPSAGNFWQAALDSGIAPSPDPNAGDHAVGLFNFPTLADATTRTRSHARLNHYSRVKESRPNYHILAEHTVSKILFEGKRAVGLEYLPTAGGDKVQVRAKKEVLLAAGALHTPQLLQLSGVGGKKFLQSFGIDVVADLPGVGENFQDQGELQLPFSVPNNLFPNSGALDTNATYDAEQRALYDDKKEGAYTIVRTLSTNLVLPPLSNATSDWKSILATARKNKPLAHLDPRAPSSVQEGYKLQREELLTQLAGQDVGIGMIHWGTAESVTLYFLKPLSRGSVRISSTDPLAQPVIDFRTLSDPVDLDVAYALFKKSKEIMSRPSMRALGATLEEPYAQVDEAGFERLLRENMSPSNAHSCCTAAMMPKEKGGVVDTEMKVYGVKGLRVVDVSYWPMVLTAAPTATTYASGEKIADIIKKEYGLKSL
ncbi:Dehydrogenase xptC [Colletotrichum orbiculare MAFF 240422]|uniref:Dehydrogenase xptC n=1 Tax=Colletotrichum orbiculare (strain 104-T / ATCC 96160 / CBS 514.97 / LARS 414 / MAFF 240422) TaxID=1213857 RepID=N4V058_COLOR|nr:Dehydrogenase xptC [Colletotrichum orbiculare MAFF 240422]